jgi:hypothetical protein
MTTNARTTDAEALPPLSDPYPAWQKLASDTCCWHCHVLLWRLSPDHLCDDCRKARLDAANQNSGAL